MRQSLKAMKTVFLAFFLATVVLMSLPGFSAATDADAQSIGEQVPSGNLTGDQSGSLPPTPVPEPTTFLLFGTGLISAAGFMKKMKRLPS